MSETKESPTPEPKAYDVVSALKKAEAFLAAKFSDHHAVRGKLAKGHAATAVHNAESERARQDLGQAHAGVAKALDYLAAFDVKHAKATALHAAAEKANKEKKS